MGSTIARAALAGFIVGIGDAFKTEGMLTTVTGAGVVQTMDTENMAKKAMEVVFPMPARNCRVLPGPGEADSSGHRGPRSEADIARGQ